MNSALSDGDAIPDLEAAGPPFICKLADRASFWLFVLTLACAPFPLGSNRPWSWSLLSLLICLSWILWCASTAGRFWQIRIFAGRLRFPILLAAVALIWGLLQLATFVPQDWAHPDWQLAGAVLQTKLRGSISLAPWLTATEVMKLATYAMAAWLAVVYAADSRRARILVDSLIVIGALYAAYALTLAATMSSQFRVFYNLGPQVHDVSGPFVNHNHYATYAGMIALCALSRLAGSGWRAVAGVKGWRRICLVLLNYIFGPGVIYLAATALTLSTLIATGSRGGNFATFAGILGMLIFALGLASRYRVQRWLAGAAVAGLICVGALFFVSGDMLGARLDDILKSGLDENVRLLLWGAAERMIHDAPLLGLGLGTYQIAYPVYSDVTLHFIIDKAHNDYLELAAGWGLPAAILWWGAMAWLIGLCVKGIYTRRRNQLYPLLAVGASLLVGIHALFDFSLQIPAVALTYAVILGVGVAQAFRTKERQA